MSTSEPTFDSPALRKARGAFFTPAALCDYIVDWAVRSYDDRVLEPACGEAAFLLSAGRRLAKLAADQGTSPAALHGVELHAASARHAQSLVEAQGSEVEVETGDFFTFEPQAQYDVVVGNPPYVRYQDFAGEARLRSRAATLRAGVPLTGLASSWAAFTVHAALCLKPGGRLGLVLPAELLTVNYAGPIRRFLMERFRNVRLVMFTERVFPGVMEEVVLVLADGFDRGPSKHCDIYQARNTSDLNQAVSQHWTPTDLEAKWSPSLLSAEAVEAYETLFAGPDFCTLQTWGETTLGMVTGNNKYFMMSPQRAWELGLTESELLPMSPPGSRHLRGLEFSKTAWNDLGREGMATYLLRPKGDPSSAASDYFTEGEKAKVNQAYKCRVRKPWWRVPLVAKADLFLTYMNADTARLCTNSAGVNNLNSVHGVYLNNGYKILGKKLLPIAALNSMTLLGAETVGRAYGGGMLKVEPKEADMLPVPSKTLIESAQQKLETTRPQIDRFLRNGKLLEAVQAIDDILLIDYGKLRRPLAKALREAHIALRERRASRGAKARDTD
ncbi:class I SAM-dependent DNA methyltransferase [Amycolatopsis sp. NPDC059027]|uniref:HsdM family class I SAM-dependent methyltransferase n=1 Tax=Amycolatopsis sp. NPDC059027 TaxID=3346709 RepID=UPI00366BABAF